MTDATEHAEDAAPRYKERRKRGGLFVNDAELIERLNVPEEIARAAIKLLDNDPRSGFPKKQELWGKRRYWPAVKAYFERSQGISMTQPPIRRVS